MSSDQNYSEVGTSNTIKPSFRQRHSRAIPLFIAVFIVVVVVVVAVAVTQTTNNSTPPPTRSNFSGENEPEVVVETSNIKKDYSTPNKCLYYTPEDSVTEMKNDPFAGFCEIGSEYVNKTCNIDKLESSSHLCEECTDGSKLPSFCFCDKKVHCVNDKKYGGRAADDSKKTCNWCADVFNNQRNHRGNASCSRASQALVKTTCEHGEGYDGFMCSVITTRVCTLTDELKNLKPCIRSNLKECFMKSKQSGKYYNCQNFMDSNLKERRKDLKTCNLDATP
ncbi:uncharacterized protein LOC134706726 [Mytilus trossulus]|uniref:uncharacterized protein LOC134706726 n=1 Tax=Mytilus trossulus TaxID=6551 RepID=UPI003003DFA3